MQQSLIADRYKLLFLRARGGFSDVEVVWDTLLARRVAIKRIHTGHTQAGLEEARTVAFLSNANIVEVHNFELVGNDTLIIMENVDGPSLAELMASSTELLDIDVATTILDGIVSALEFAHENQVFHLDIKPANVLINQSGHIKVSDFGLAELAGSSGYGEVQGGTIGYMPPEQLTGAAVDARTDIWALAALSYQLLTGINPFFALSPRESLRCITEVPYSLPSAIRPELGGAIDEALIRALNPLMENRPSTVAEFWAELRPHLGRVGPGRRRLKSLAHAWAGKEATLLEGPGSNTGVFLRDEYADEDFEDLAAEYHDSSTSEEDGSAVWSEGYEEEDAAWSERDLERRMRRAEERAQRRAERAARGPLPPLWERLGPQAQSFFARSFSALAAGSMVWLAMSALPYLSDPLAQAASAAAANTGNPTPALLDAAFAVRIALALIAAVLGLAAPVIGSAVAAAALVFGIFFTGNWFLGNLLLVGCVAWWICVGRRSVADSVVFMLSPILALLSLPMLLPLLAGFFLTWKRALGTTLLACFVCSLLSLLTSDLASFFLASLFGIGEVPVYGQFGTQPLWNLLGAAPTLMQMPDSNQLFIPLISLFTSLEFWLIFACWAGASVVVSLLSNGKSRVKYVIVMLCGAGIEAMGYLLTLFVVAGADNGILLAAVLTRLLIAWAVCVLLVVLGVQPKPCASQ